MEAVAFGVFVVATMTNHLPKAFGRRRIVNPACPFLLLLFAPARPRTNAARALRTVMTAPRMSTLSVLWPDEPGAPGDDPNNHAIVLLASYGQVDALLTADAETNVTGRLHVPPVEILKVAHHGSADAGLTRQLEQIHPRVAVISVGAHNDYGHPSPSTIAALAAVPGLAVYRTDRDGRVVVESDGTRISVRDER